MSGAYRARPQSAMGSTRVASAGSTLARTQPRPASGRRPAAAGAGGPSSAALAAQRARRAQQVDRLEGNLLADRMHTSMHISKEEKENMVEALAAEQNGYLLMLLEKEQSNEQERVRILASIDDVGDQRRLEKIFAIERAKASTVIRAVTRQHEETLALKLQDLGMISDDDDEDYMHTNR